MTTDGASNDSAFAALRQTGERLAPDLRARILSFGDAAVPPLVALLADDAAAAEDAPGQGWPPVHAVDLLADLKAEAAILPLLAVLRGGDMDDRLSSRVAIRLPTLGSAVLEPALTELASLRDPERAVTLCAILANLGVRDERVWQALARCFAAEPSLSAGLLAAYGDHRALPLLERAIFAFDIRGPSPLARLDLELLVQAYVELAGELPPELTRHADSLLELLPQSRDRAPSPRPPANTRIGRNDPCPCGSGKKHKRCCLV
jgi:SEC-C motif